MKKKKLKLSATVHSVCCKKLGLVKVKLWDLLPDSGWDALREVADANHMTIAEICAEHEPFIFNDLAELRAEDVELSDVTETMESGW